MPLRSTTANSTNNIQENAEKSNTNKSLDVDTDGNTLTEAQQEYFKDSKVKNADMRFSLDVPVEETKDLIAVHNISMEYKNNENRLYLAVAKTKINEADVVGNTGDNDVAQTNLLSTSNISIVNIFKKINPQDKNFLKYIPDEFLNAEQKKAKVSALDIEAEKYGKKDNADSSLSVCDK